MAITNSPSVLVVDDAPNMVRVLGAGLEAVGCRARTAPGAPEALQCVLSQPFDCVVIDQKLEHIDGSDALKVLQAASPPGTPFVFLTVRDDPDLRLRAYASGATRVLVKPFDLSELVAAVQQVTQARLWPADDASLLPGTHVTLDAGAAPSSIEGWVIEGEELSASIQVRPGSVGASVLERSLRIAAATAGGVRTFSAVARSLDAAEGRLTVHGLARVETRQRRRHPRVRVGRPVTLTTEDTVAVGQGLAREVSLGGMSVALPVYAGTGMRVTVSWSDAEGQPGPDPPVSGTVVRSRRVQGNGGIGVSVLAIRFGGLPSPAREHLRGLVAGAAPV